MSGDAQSGAWFSFHGGHSGQFCRHAKGELEAVVQAAIAAGFTQYGLTEHCPRYEVADLYPDERAGGVAALTAAFEAYRVEARRLQVAYADEIELLVGFETERTTPLEALGDFDLVVGSVHDLGPGRWIDYSAEITAALARDLGGRDALHRAYFEAVAAMVEAFSPDVVGHLDLVRKFDGAGATVASDVGIERALEATKAAGAVLDVNAGAHRRGYSPVYPLPWILERARVMGIGVTLGDDSHGPHDVGVGLDACLSAIAAAGYREVTCLTRSGRRVVPLDKVRPGVPGCPP